jgi:hypothetical protein
VTDQDCLLTDCWPLRALSWLAVAGWRRVRHAIRQHIPGLPAHTQASKECQKVAQDMSAHGRQEEGQDQARGLHMRCAGRVRERGGCRRARICAVPPLGREPMAQCREALTGGQESWQERRERLLARRDGQTPSVPTTWTVLGAL